MEWPKIFLVLKFYCIVFFKISQLTVRILYCLSVAKGLVLSFNMVVIKEPAWVCYPGKNMFVKAYYFMIGEKNTLSVPEWPYISSRHFRWVLLGDVK